MFNPFEFRFAYEHAQADNGNETEQRFSELKARLRESLGFEMSRRRDPSSEDAPRRRGGPFSRNNPPEGFDRRPGYGPGEPIVPPFAPPNFGGPGPFQPPNPVQGQPFNPGESQFTPEELAAFCPPGASPSGRRWFGRGDVKFALLELLLERPMHGYEMMKALEERSGGFYVPSAGTIYPTLQMLEDRGLVTVNQTTGKKVYEITEAGRTQLAERQNEEASTQIANLRDFYRRTQMANQQNEEAEFEKSPWGRHFEYGPNHPYHRADVQAARTKTRELVRMLLIAAHKGALNPQKLEQLNVILEQTKNALITLISSTDDGDNEL